MKKCPQCNTIYEEEVLYCLKDGTSLENFDETDEEESETIIRHHPPAFDFSAAERVNEPIIIDFSKPEPSTTEKPVPQVITVVEPPKSSGKYGIGLLVGLLLGGILVLAGMLLARNFYNRNDTANSAKEEKININLPAEKNAPAKTADAENTHTANAKHQTRTSASDGEFNGRVITLNAYVRSSPSKNASEIDILPMNDRINIEQRDNPNSPWFKVVCEHGVSGWMHGDTIEYVR